MFLTWTSAGSESVIYEVMWSSNQCPDDVDEGSTTITDGSTTYTIINLRGGTLYIVNVTASNGVNSKHGSIGKNTKETGMYEKEVYMQYSLYSLSFADQFQLPLPLL